MKVDRLSPDYYWTGSSLTVREMAEDGFAELELQLPKDGLLLQYKSNLQFVLKNRKRADGIVFFPVSATTWGMLLVELKRKVHNGNKWQDIKSQWHGAWLHGIAIAAVRDIKLAARVDVMVAYRHHHMGAQMPDPILLKQITYKAIQAQAEWATGKVNLPELGDATLHRKQLDEVSGLGQYAFT